MKHNMPYLSFSARGPGAASLLMKAAAEKNTEIMRFRTVAEHREAITKLAEVRPVFPGVVLEPVSCNSVYCQWVFLPDADADRVILYIHGGSWMFGNLKTAQAPAELIAEATGYRVLAVDYRLAPEHPFPAGLDDCLKVWNWLLEQGLDAKQVALLGDSAGGNLSLALIHRLKAAERALPACAGLASPVPDMTADSEIVRSRDNLIYTKHGGAERDIFSLYLNGHDPADPLASPICGELAGFPPLLVHVGGAEPLSVDCLAFVKKAYEQGVDAALKVYKEMFHDFTIVGVTLKESRDSIRAMGEFFKTHLK